MEKVFSYRKNSQILDSFVSYSDTCIFLYEKLSNSDGCIFYTKMHIFDGDKCRHVAIQFTDGEEYVKEKAAENDDDSDDDCSDMCPALEKRLDMPLTYNGQEEEENNLHGDCKPLDPNTDLEKLKNELDE